MDSRGREFAGLSIAGLILYFSYSLSRSPVVPLYARSLGASVPLVGWIVAASTITGIVVKLPAGTLSDHFGRRSILLAGGCFFAFTPFLYAGVSSIGMLILLRVIHGNATAIFGPGANAAISDISAPSQRGIRLGLYSSMQGVGQALGPFLGGALITNVGLQSPFLLSGAIGCIGFVCLMWAVKRRTRQARGRPRAALLQGLRAVAGNRALLVTSLTVASLMMVVGSYNGLFPLYAKEILGIDAWHIGAMFGLQTTTTLLARPLMGRFSDRVGRKSIIVVALLWSSTLIALLPYLRSMELLLAFGSAWGLGLSVVSSVAGALITDLSSTAYYGAAHGAYGTIYDLGEATGPVLAGLIVTHFGYHTMFMVMGVLLFISMCAFLQTRIPVTPTGVSRRVEGVS